MYSSVDPRTNIHTQWSVSEARELELPPQRLEVLMHDAIFTALGREPERTTAEPATWRVPVRSGLSVFDERELVVVLTACDGFARVEAAVSFDASANRVGAVLWLTQSLVGLPLGLAWRAVSIREARGFARTVFRALWATLGRHVGRAYR